MATISLNLNAQGIKTGARDAKQSLDSVKQSATSTEAAVVRSGNNMGSAITRMGNMSGAQRFVFQNTANQLGDIAVQASMGTNIFRVLGMQLPQIAGGFAILGGAMGTVLPILGVIAAVGFPIIAMFTSMGQKSKSAADMLDEFSDSLQDADAVVKASRAPLSELTNEFGIYAQNIKDTAEALRQLTLQDLTRDIMSATRQLSNFGKTVGIFERLRFGSEDFGAAQRKLVAQLEISKDEANLLVDALGALEDVKTPEDIVEVMGDLFKVVNDLNPKTDEGADALFELAKAASQAEADAAKLVTVLSDVKTGVTDIGEITQFQAGGRGSVIPNAMDILMMGMGGEIVGGPEKKDTKLDREKQKLATFAEQFQPVLTAAAEYEETMTKLNRAREIGAITEEQHAQATAVATDKYRIAAGELVDYTNVANIFANSLENSMMQLVQGTLSVEDAFKNMALAVIKELYRVLVVQQIVNAAMGAFGFSPAAGGGFVPTGDAGAFGGPVSPSQGIVVGERGPEVFFPPSKGNLVPNSDLGGVQVHQSFNFAANGDESVKRIIAQQAPKIAKMTQQSIMESRRRGGQMKAVFG
ncbi:MAG: hypothetical protein ACPGZR_09225 [Paracoccaceae bacterium]